MRHRLRSLLLLLALGFTTAGKLPRRHITNKMRRSNVVMDEIDAADSEQQQQLLRIPIPPIDPNGVKGVLSRMPQWVGDRFGEVILSPSSSLAEGEAHVFQGNDGRISVHAETTVDALYAIHAYIRQFCFSMVAWDGAAFSNGACKKLEQTLTFHSPKVRFFGNPCTFSYSMVWWNWAKWEQFIDWLALSGFNMVLAPVGQEFLWKQHWQDLGVSAEGVDAFLSGPAFYAWHRMGNIQRFGGAASDDFLAAQAKLNKRIVSRMTSLGIVPVLPTFAGFVPKEFVDQHPDIKFTKNRCWLTFNDTNSCVYSISPTEPLFGQIAEHFIAKQRAFYGDATHVYSADAYNEIPPATFDERALRQMAKAIYGGCRQGDEQCVWVLQSWAFSYDGWSDAAIAAFLSGVPVGKLLVLDLQAENAPLYRKAHFFYGHAFVWGALHNFGGSVQLRGNLERLDQDYTDAEAALLPNLVGGGVTMEAIGQNYVFYQFVIDRLWKSAPIDTAKWINVYAAARYGANMPIAQKAWRILLATFYAQPRAREDKESYEIEEANNEPFKVFIYERPRMNGRIEYWFSTSQLELLAKYFTQLNRTLGQNPLFRQDYHDVMREHLQFLLGNRAILRLYEGYGLHDASIMRTACDRIERHFEELDLIAGRDLSSWLISARDAATSAAEADVFEREALNQLTLWGPAGNVLDYARKEWSGLIRKYYARRWSLFCTVLLEHAAVPFNQTAFNRRVFSEVELPFGRL